MTEYGLDCAFFNSVLDNFASEHGEDVSFVELTAEGGTGVKKLDFAFIPNLVTDWSECPASEDTLGKIVQYVGVTDQNYTNGYFYECVSDGGNPATYSWEQVDVQPQGGSVSDVQINNTSILSGGVANLMAQGTYNASTNKLATMSEVPHLLNGTGSGSVMTNFQNSLTGNNSAIFGLYSDVSGNDSMFIGTEGTISKPCSLGVGTYIYIQSGSGRSAAIGYNVDVSNSDTLAVGNNLYTGSNCQIVGGKNNISGNYVFNLGNGTANNATSNAHTIDWSGNAWFAGDVYVGSTSGTNKDAGSKKLATEDAITIKTYELSGLAAYDNTSTYAVGDYVYYNNLIYKCNTAVTTAEDFDSQKWTQKTYIEYMTDMIVGSALTQNY